MRQMRVEYIVRYTQMKIEFVFFFGTLFCIKKP